MIKNSSKTVVHRFIRASVAVYVSVGLGGVVAHAEEAGEPRPSPLSYVAPEFRTGLEQAAEYTGGEALQFTDERLPAIRAGFVQRAAGQEMLPAPSVEEKLIPGPKDAPAVRVFVIGADPAKTRPAILHMHGGGYVIGEARSDVPHLQAIAAKHDGVIVTVDYRLAPETKFPGALEDNYAALQWLYQNADKLGVDRTRISVMGESAGGGHAAMLAIAARDRGEISLKSQILVYPMLDDRTASSREMPYWMGYGSWTQDANRYGWTALLGVPAGSEKVPYGAVPARVENLAGLPDTFIGVGSVDLFAEENVEYTRRLIRAGVPTQLMVQPGGFHGFQFFMPEAKLSKQFDAVLDAAIARAFEPAVDGD